MTHSPAKRMLGTLLATILAFAVTAPTVLFAVLLLAGPHGGALPSSLHNATLILGWLVIVAVPTLIGRWAWRCLAPRTAIS